MVTFSRDPGFEYRARVLRRIRVGTMFSRLATLLALAALGCACSDTGTGLLLRQDTPDVWSGEVWVLSDPGTREETPHETDDGWPVDAGAPDRDTGREDAGPPPPIRFLSDQQVLPALLDLIAQASTSLDLVQLEFLAGFIPDQIQSALLAAAARGVVVRVLLEKDVDDNASRVPTLLAGGVQARLDGSSKTLHTKLVVADGHRVLVGSTNLSTSSLKYNHEANFLFEEDSIGAAFAEYANGLWVSDGALESLPPALSGQVAGIGDAQYLERVRPLLSSASRRVLVVLYQLDPDDQDSDSLLQALFDARSRGADVRVLLESSAFADDVNAANQKAASRLVAGGIPVRFDSKDVVTHAKLVVCDDRVVVYSGNWVGSALRRNHEAGAIVDSVPIAEEAAGYFEQRWAEGTP